MGHDCSLPAGALPAVKESGTALRPSFRMFGAPYTGYLTLAFLLAVIVPMGFDYPVGTWTVASIIIIVPLLVAGWYLSRGRIRAIAAERDDCTGRIWWWPTTLWLALQIELGIAGLLKI